MQVIDTPALREYLGANGPWAKECGERVAKFRQQMGQSETWLAAVVGTTAQSIRMIEAGRIVPREYLRAAIAFALGKDLDTIWPPLSRSRVGEIGQVA